MSAHARDRDQWNGRAPSPRWAGCPVIAERVVVDPRGEECVVREVDARATPGAPAPRCLILENHHRVWRLWDFPADWARLSDAAVLRLGDTAP